MPKWVSVVLVIVAFFAIAALWERRRVTAMEAWRQAFGFAAIDPFVPNDHKPIQKLASLATGADSSGLPWASVMTGASNGTTVTFAELSYSPTAGHTSKWFTLAVWPEPNARGPVVLGKGGRSVAGTFARAVSTSMGVASEEPVVLVGSLSVMGEPTIWRPWLTQKRQHAMDSWPHGGRFVFVDGYAGWITEGLLSPARADELVAQVDAARRALQ